MLDIRV